jgi:hypothetical protein
MASVKRTLLMNLRLDDNQKTLLREVLQKNSPEMLSVFDAPALLTDEQRIEICRILTDEFCLTGLGEDSEPNQRGMLLEDLIDIVNPKLNGH